MRNGSLKAPTACILPGSIRINLHHTLIYPYLSFCDMIWISTYATRLHKLEVLKRRACGQFMWTMAIYRVADTAPFYRKYGILSINQIRPLRWLNLFTSMIDNYLLLRSEERRVGKEC